MAKNPQTLENTRKIEEIEAIMKLGIDGDSPDFISQCFSIYANIA